MRLRGVTEISLQLPQHRINRGMIINMTRIARSPVRWN
jgi:hypothetical protein